MMDIKKLVKDGITSLSGLEYIREAESKPLTPEELKKVGETMKELFDNSFTNNPDVIKKYEAPTE